MSVVNKEEKSPGDPARLLSSRPESRGLQPAGAPARPRRERKRRLTPAFRQVVGPLVQLPDIGVEGGRAKVVIILRRGYQMKLAPGACRLKF